MNSSKSSGFNSWTLKNASHLHRDEKIRDFSRVENKVGGTLIARSKIASPCSSEIKDHKKVLNTAT